MMSISTDITGKKYMQMTNLWYEQTIKYQTKMKWKKITLSWSGSLLKKRKENLCQKKIIRHSASLETYNICTDNHHTFVSMKEMKNCLPCLEMTVSWKREK